MSLDAREIHAYWRQRTHFAAPVYCYCLLQAQQTLTSFLSSLLQSPIFTHYCSHERMDALSACSVTPVDGFSREWHSSSQAHTPCHNLVAAGVTPLSLKEGETDKGNTKNYFLVPANYIAQLIVFEIGSLELLVFFSRSPLTLVTIKVFLKFCRTWMKQYLITSQTRVTCASQIHHHTILPGGSVVYPVTRVALVSEVIRYCLFKAWQNLRKTLRAGGPLSPFPISSSFVLFSVLLPFLLKTEIKTIIVFHYRL